ncbi:PIN domain-containing protein [Reichenbachiella sp. MALMAid0571]|uniref:PIN domain-containing protein n=1 Tax=Reichenbachiella sp. MALMAid0571 TaxID=3143939 RepID=UPI0032DF93AA
MAKVFSINDYSPKSSETYFLDTNVWLYLFCPIANHRDKEQRIYSSFYKLLTQGDHSIFVNSLVASEFANAYLRIDFRLWKEETKNFNADYKRDFVRSNRFISTVNQVKKSLRVILSKAHRMTDNFNAIELDHVFSEFGRSDFNDSYYLELSRMNNWKIVTHDADLFKSNQLDVDVITGNR